MYTSSLRLFPCLDPGGKGGFSASWTKVSGNCIKWINPVLNFSLLGGEGGFSSNWTKVAGNCMKWIDPVLKFFPPFGGGGGLFCQLNQSCCKLHEMDRSILKKFSLFGHWWGGGAFLLGPQWDVQWCIKYCLVKLHHIWWYKPSIWPKGRGGSFFADSHQVEVLPVEYNSFS